MNLKERIREDYPGLFGVLKEGNRYRRLLWNRTFEQLGCLKRKYFPFLPSRYTGIRKLKGIHAGEKCFIVATGPSLTIHDLEMLKGHMSISMNSIVLSYEKTDWRPSYYAVQDCGVVSNIFSQGYDLWKILDIDKTIIAHFVNKKFYVPKGAKIYYLDLEGHDFDYEEYSPSPKPAKFSDDCFSRVYDGYTITYSCIELAVYMGFTEIYLLGVDCNFTGKNDHAFGYTVTGSSLYEMTNKNDILRIRMINSYTAAKKYADSHGIKIFNATRGGKLEVFPRISLEEALKD